MKKACLIFMGCVMVLLILCSCNQAQTSLPIEDFTYEFRDGEAYITGYTGADLEIIIPDMINERPVTHIGEEAFAEYDLTKIVLPDTITYIDNSAFRACHNLKDVTLSKNLKEIDYFAFYDCTSLEKIVLPDSVEKLSAQGTFGGCDNLQEVTMSESLYQQSCDQFITDRLGTKGIFYECYNAKVNGIPVYSTEYNALQEALDELSSYK